MPDLSNRSGLESAYSEEFASALAELQSGYILDKYRDGFLQGDIEELNEEERNRFKELLGLILAAMLVNVFLQSARQLGRLLAFPPSDDVIEAANAFAERRTQEILDGTPSVNGLLEVTDASLQRTANQNPERELSRQDLTALLSNNRIFGSERGSLLAVTEITEAMSAGENYLVQQLEDAGLTVVKIYNTAEDDRVCPICAPLNTAIWQAGQWMIDNEPVITDMKRDPPVHPGCRCYLSYEVLNENGVVMARA